MSQNGSIPEVDQLLVLNAVRNAAHPRAKDNAENGCKAWPLLPDVVSSVLPAGPWQLCHLVINFAPLGREACKAVVLRYARWHEAAGDSSGGLTMAEVALAASAACTGPDQWQRKGLIRLQTSTGKGSARDYLGGRGMLLKAGIERQGVRRCLEMWLGHRVDQTDVTDAGNIPSPADAADAMFAFGEVVCGWLVSALAALGA